MTIGKANAGVDDLVSPAMEEGLERCLTEPAKAHENKTLDVSGAYARSSSLTRQVGRELKI